MNLVIQAISISGKMIEGARWEVTNSCSFQKDQKISVELPITDPKLIGYLSKTNAGGCMIDGEKENFSVIIPCLVNEIRHMIHISNKTVDSMIIVVPLNRTGENIFRYILEPAICDQRFMKMVRGE